MTALAHANPRPPACLRPRAGLADVRSVSHAVRARARRRSSGSSARATAARPPAALPSSGPTTAPDRWRRLGGGVPVKPMRPDQGWCEDMGSPRYNRPVRLPCRRLHRPDVAGRPPLRSRLRARPEFHPPRERPRQRDLLSPRPAGPDADLGLRRHFAIRHAQARAPARPRMRHAHRVEGSLA